MTLSRTKLVALLAPATIAMVLGSWFHTGWQSASLEAESVRARPELEARGELRELAAEFSSRLRELLASEDLRPYYHYKNLYHDPRGLSQGLSVQLSPLVEASGDPWISSHFQIDGEGLLTIPQINEDVQKLSQTKNRAVHQRQLQALRDAKTAFEAAPLVVMRRSEAPEREVFQQQAFTQNVVANSVFRELETQQAMPAVPAKGSALLDTSDRRPVEVSIHPFSWRSATIEEVQTLVAMRRVETPVGVLSQGFVLDPAKLSDWLASGLHQSSLVSLHGSPDPSQLSIAIPNLEDWYLRGDISSEQSLAEAQAAGLHAAFAWTFAPVATASLLLVVMLIVVVARSESLAKERSLFAAAAAHELRTPLAGLQLYGDMLADGLGDANAKEKYARHIAGEAQRLGRVVSNVLDFSQMEQQGLQLHPKQGDIASAVSRVVERMRDSLELAGMKLEIVAPEPVEALFDDDALGRILQNLIDNAEKYSREAEDRSLQIRVSEGPDFIYVSVSDGGPGVAVSMRQQIFRPFLRAGGEDSPAGLGLGLALARSLAKEQGGDLRLEESPLGGASFVIQVPKL